MKSTDIRRKKKKENFTIDLEEIIFEPQLKRRLQSV